MVTANPLLSLEAQRLGGGKRETRLSPFISQNEAERHGAAENLARESVFDLLRQAVNQQAPAPVFSPQPRPRPDPNAPSGPTKRVQGQEQVRQAPVRVAQADTGVTSDATPARMTGQQFFSRLVDRGLPPIGAAGLAGSVEQESQFDPLAEGGGTDPKTGRGRSRGVFQVEGPRLEAFLAFAEENALNPDDIETQLEFFLEELVTTERPAAKAIFEAKTVEEAVDAANKFFRPGKPKTENRLRNALKIELGGSNQPDQAVAPRREARADQPGGGGGGAPIRAPLAPLTPDDIEQFIKDAVAGSESAIPAPKPTAAPRRAPVPVPSPVQAAAITPPGRRSAAGAVPVAWQTALNTFLKSGDKADLSVVPQGSKSVLLALLGKSVRGRA